MNIETQVVPWIEEVQSYLNDESKKTGDLKKVLKNADFEKLSYADKARLYKMFDPKCQISEELFKRQLNLYFKLLESKSSPIKIPIFSDYVDWIYSQDPDKISDKSFDIMTSRLLKTTAADISESIKSFMDKIPQSFDKPIDKLSNARISTLIDILNELGMEYSQMPEECKGFVREMFKACAVKSEIADKNKDRVRRLFKQDPRYYYNIFNKAFAGYSEYATWIDEPAKKITIPHMVNYANLQEKVLANYRRPLHYDAFVTYAQELNLPTFPAYDKSSSTYSHFYLKEPREYKDYAKKMGDIFVGLVKDEVKRVDGLLDQKRVSEYDLYTYALTNLAKTQMKMLNPDAPRKMFLCSYAEKLIDLVHLNELTGQRTSDIFELIDIREPDNVVHTPKVYGKPDPRHPHAEEYEPRRNDDVEGQLSLFDNTGDEGEYRSKNGEGLTYFRDDAYTVKDLPDLYEKYEESVRQGKDDFALAEFIVSLEDRRIDMMEDKTFGDE